MSDSDLLSAVFPHLNDVLVEGIEQREEVVQIFARTCRPEAACTDCGALSQRVHTRYVRHLADVATGGRQVRIALTVRRFRCSQSGCRRRTFAEQIPELASRYQRRTTLLNGVLEGIAVMLAGRAGARLARRLQVAVSRFSLLRLLRTVHPPTVGDGVTAIGIDDFALRRGRIYGTVVIDMDTHRPLDVLPDRTAASVADWLKNHPGITVICRDRAGAYAEGARTGAPDATQVADRWHLYKNLAEAVEKIVNRYRKDLPEPEPSIDSSAAQPIPNTHTQPSSAIPQVISQPRSRLAERSIERHQAVRALLDAGRNLSAISRELGLARHTVRRFAQADITDLVNDSRERRSILDNFKAHLHQRWNNGARDAAQLYREIIAHGYRGSPQTVRLYLHRFRDGRETPTLNPRPPSVREVTEWLTRRPTDLSDDETTALSTITARSPALATTYGLIRRFAGMMTHLQGEYLPAWRDQVDHHGEAELRTFAKGLRRDFAAVTAGLTLPYSSGPVEGNVNRIILWNLICPVCTGLPCRTAAMGRSRAVLEGWIWRGVGPAGVGVSASLASRRSTAFWPSVTAACSSSVSGIETAIL